MIGRSISALALAIAAISAQPVQAQQFLPFIFPQQRTIEVRDPSELARIPIPETPPPPTVSTPRADLPLRNMSLDEAIRTALDNSDIVRVLAGVSAVSSGRTIYDTAITNSGIDEQRARFDPTVEANNGFNRFETPRAVFDPFDPALATINGLRTDDYNLGFDLSKTTITGGKVNVGVNTNPSRFRPGVFPLNPQNRSSAELGFTQPLLQGGGIGANLVPIVLARIDVERSYFQFKDSVQQMVRGVIDVYWAMVLARTDVWARQQQVDQAREAYERADANLRAGLGNLGDVAQARSALANFRAALIAAQADVLQREGALRNLLGLPPYDSQQIVPVTPPTEERLEMDWHGLLSLAEERRPDIIELKLILEADEQLLLQARNQALPSVDAAALYRWNGLEGEMPGGLGLSSRPGQFTDWTLAVNFSVPLGLRRERAVLRRQELIIARDRANLQQGLHGAVHDVAVNLRNLAQFYEQYLAFKETRQASRINLEVQLAEYRFRGGIFLNVLQAIGAWGNAVSSEAQALLQYNVELANLELQTGTILESHGIRFYEERYGSLGPLGRLHPDESYPSELRPTRSVDRYPAGEQPAEQSFDLRPPEDLQQRIRERLEELPPVRPPERNEPSADPRDATRQGLLRWLKFR